MADATAASADGSSIIPATRRPDGTMRKEIKVRAGYVPQDEVGAFQTKAHRENAAGPRPIPGASSVPIAASQPLTAAQKKNLKRKENRQKKQLDGASSEASSVSDIIAKVAAVEMTDGSSQPDASAGPSGDASEVAAHSGNGIDWDKRAKNLRKKLKLVNELIERVASGAVVPSADQQEKIGRKQELEFLLEEAEGKESMDWDKKIKAASKKLKLVNELIERVSSGSIVPSADQQEKMGRKGELEALIAVYLRCAACKD